MSAGDIAAVEQTLARLELDGESLERSREAALLGRLRTRDLAAFEELVGHFERPVYSLCFRMLGDAEEARDAAQETFLKVYRGLAHFRGDSGLKTWIYRIALNQASNQRRWWRRRHREDTVSLDLNRERGDWIPQNAIASPGSSPEDIAIASQRERRVLRALSELKEEHRIVLILREVEEFSYEEIAQTLGISMGTVKSRIARGRDELRRRVKGLI